MIQKRGGIKDLPRIVKRQIHLRCKARWTPFKMIAAVYKVTHQRRGIQA